MSDRPPLELDDATADALLSGKDDRSAIVLLGYERTVEGMRRCLREPPNVAPALVAFLLRKLSEGPRYPADETVTTWVEASTCTLFERDKYVTRLRYASLEDAAMAYVHEILGYWLSTESPEFVEATDDSGWKPLGDFFRRASEESDGGQGEERS